MHVTVADKDFVLFVL